MDGKERRIGKVTATQKDPTSCNTVRFWVHRDEIIRPFDIVKIKHIPRGREGKPSYTYANGAGPAVRDGQRRTLGELRFL